MDKVELAAKRCYVDKDGNIYKRLMPKGNRYLKFGLTINGKRLYIPIHRLQAFQKFGMKMFEPGIEVRHLNNNNYDNSWDNIALGTRSENMLDLF